MQALLHKLLWCSTIAACVGLPGLVVGDIGVRGATKKPVVKDLETLKAAIAANKNAGAGKAGGKQDSKKPASFPGLAAFGSKVPSGASKKPTFPTLGKKPRPTKPGAFNTKPAGFNIKGPRGRPPKGGSSGPGGIGSKMPDLKEAQEKQFKLLDEDMDGKVAVHEVEATKRKLKERKEKEGTLQTFENSLLNKIDTPAGHEDWHKKQDKNGDGYFTLEEYREMMKNRYPKAGMGSAPTKKKGGFNMPDMATIHKKQEDQFHVMDDDGDGKVTVSELKLVMNKLKARRDFPGGNKALSELDRTVLTKLEKAKDSDFKAIHTNRDNDGDGYLTLDEFYVKPPKRGPEL